MKNYLKIKNTAAGRKESAPKSRRKLIFGKRKYFGKLGRKLCSFWKRDKVKKVSPAAAARIVLTKTYNKSITSTALLDNDHGNGEEAIGDDFDDDL